MVAKAMAGGHPGGDLGVVDLGGQAFYIAGAEQSAADFLMYNQLLNVLAMLRLKDSQSNVDYSRLLKAKYPAVSLWLENMEKVNQVRKYQIEFEI